MSDTRVEFYVLPDTSEQARRRTACVLAGKGWRAGLPVFLRASDEAECEALDALLWEFREESFVPHGRHAEDPLAPVVIGIDEVPSAAHGLLVNLKPDLSPQLAHFSRVIEIVNQQPELLSACRENFRDYRKRGYEPRRVEL